MEHTDNHRKGSDVPFPALKSRVLVRSSLFLLLATVELRTLVVLAV